MFNQKVWGVRDLHAVMSITRSMKTNGTLDAPGISSRSIDDRKEDDFGSKISEEPCEEEIEELSEENVYQPDEGSDYDPSEDSGYQSEQPGEVLNEEEEVEQTEETDHNDIKDDDHNLANKYKPDQSSEAIEKKSDSCGKQRRSRWDPQPECSGEGGKKTNRASNKRKNPSWKRPADYNPEKLNKRLYIPINEYPGYGFIGQIAGRGGHILKKMEKESGSKIIIRGKSMRKAGQKTHKKSVYVFIEADNQKSMDAAVPMVEKLLIQVIERARLERSLKYDKLCRTSPLTTPAMVDDSKLFVRYLPNTMDDGCLQEIFAPFGRVIEAKVIKDRKTGESKGYGFVKYESLSSAAMAVVGMNGFEIDGRTLAVKSAGKEPKSTPVSWPGPPGSMLESTDNFLLPRSSSVFSSSGCSSPLSLENFPGNPDYRSSQFLSYVTPPPPPSEVLPSQSQQSSRISPFTWTHVAAPGNGPFRYS